MRATTPSAAACAGDRRCDAVTASGDLEGDLEGDLVGDLAGDLEGDRTGDELADRGVALAGLSGRVFTGERSGDNGGETVLRASLSGSSGRGEAGTTTAATCGGGDEERGLETAALVLGEDFLAAGDFRVVLDAPEPPELDGTDPATRLLTPVDLQATRDYAGATRKEPQRTQRAVCCNLWQTAAATQRLTAAAIADAVLAAVPNGDGRRAQPVC